MQMDRIDLQRPPVLHGTGSSFEAQVMFNQGRHVALGGVCSASLSPKVDGGRVDTDERDAGFCCCRACWHAHGDISLQQPQQVQPGWVGLMVGRLNGQAAKAGQGRAARAKAMDKGDLDASE